MQSTFLENRVTVEHAREYGHTHLFEVGLLNIVIPVIPVFIQQLISYNFTCLCALYVDDPTQIINHAKKFKNKAILLIHFSARYTTEVRLLPVYWSLKFMFLTSFIVQGFC